jgi:hypothetical protein
VGNRGRGTALKRRLLNVGWISGELTIRVPGKASAAVKMPVRPARNVEYTDNLKSVEEILSRNGHIFVELKDKVIVVFNIVNYVSYILQGNLSLSPL